MSSADPRLQELGPRPSSSSGWLALRDWLRRRNELLRLPRARYPLEDAAALPAPLELELVEPREPGLDPELDART